MFVLYRRRYHNQGRGKSSSNSSIPKSQSKKMMLGEIKTSGNLFEISPIDSESQPYVQNFSRNFFAYFTHHQSGNFLSSRNKGVNWALKSILGTTKVSKWSCRQCLILSSFYHSFCRTSSKGSHDLSDNVRRIQQTVDGIDEIPKSGRPFRESTNSTILASLKLSGHKIDSGKNRNSLVKSKV